MAKILCPFHKDTTPSCEVYADGFYCFVCRASGPISALGKLDFIPTTKPAPVDIKAEFSRISTLPKARVRGLDLPVDSNGYYIVWPGNGYFKHRQWIADERGKYRCPRGHKKPLFAAREITGDAVALVEGELNALSLASIEPPFSIVSPGGVGDFNEKLLDSPVLSRYTRYLLVLDKDKPGLDAAVKMRKLLLPRTPYVEIRLMERDCNDLLQDGKLKEEVASWGKMAVPTRMQSRGTL